MEVKLYKTSVPHLMIFGPLMSDLVRQPTME